MLAGKSRQKQQLAAQLGRGFYPNAVDLDDVNTTLNSNLAGYRDKQAARQAFASGRGIASAVARWQDMHGNNSTGGGGSQQYDPVSFYMLGLFTGGPAQGARLAQGAADANNASADRTSRNAELLAKMTQDIQQHRERYQQGEQHLEQQRAANNVAEKRVQNEADETKLKRDLADEQLGRNNKDPVAESAKRGILHPALYDLISQELSRPGVNLPGRDSLRGGGMFPFNLFGIGGPEAMRAAVEPIALRIIAVQGGIDEHSPQAKRILSQFYSNWSNFTRPTDAPQS